jgi:hypothetical protein
VNQDTPRLAADFAILDVLLPGSAPGIKRDLDGLTAIGTLDDGFDVGGSVA